MSEKKLTTRRKMLAASGATVALGLAGCVGGGDDDHDDTGAGDNHDDHGHDDHDDHDDHGHDHLGIEEFDLIDRGEDEVTAYLHGDHWHGDPLEVNEGDTLSLGSTVIDDHGDEIALGADLELRARLDDGAPEIVEFDYHGDHVHIIGLEEGLTDVVFQLWHDDHADYETPPITVIVGDDHDDHDDDHDDHDD